MVRFVVLINSVVLTVFHRNKKVKNKKTIFQHSINYQQQLTDMMIIHSFPLFLLPDSISYADDMRPSFSLKL